MGLEGNLCRCTGYHNIVKSVLAGADAMASQSSGAHVIPAAFDYVRADSVEDAIALLAEHGDDAKFLAGGHSLLPLMKLRLAQPSVLVDVGALRDLVVRPRRRRPHRDRRAHPSPRRRAQRRAARARAVARARRRRGRRPAGAPPRHDRRLARARRSRVRPAGVCARAPRHDRGPRQQRRARDRGRRLLRGLPRDRARARRGDHRGARAEDHRRRVRLPEVQPARPGLGDRRRRRGGRRHAGRRARQHGFDADPGRRRSRPDCATADRPSRPPRWPPTAPNHRPT